MLKVRSLFVLGLFAFAPTAHAQSFVFTKIVDTSTPVPGGIGKFSRFNTVASSGSNVTFTAPEGLYARIGGQLRVIADNNTQADGGYNFNMANYRSLVPSIDGSNIAFAQFIHIPYLETKIFTYTNGTLHALETGNFANYSNPTISGNNVAFITSDDYSTFNAAYVSNGITLTQIAAGNFGPQSSNIGKPALSGSNIAYTEFDPVSTNKIIAYDTIIDGITNHVPVATTYAFPSLPVMRGKSIVYATPTGVYETTNGITTTIANNSILAANGIGFSGQFVSPSFLNDNDVMFECYSGLNDVICVSIGGKVTQVIAKGQMFNGSRVRGINLGNSQDGIAFELDTDTDKSVYLATLAVPEPGSTVLFGAVALTGAVSLRRRRRK